MKQNINQRQFPHDKITKCSKRVTLKQHVNNHKETTTNKKHVIHY